jgi:hypothetical protein
LLSFGLATEPDVVAAARRLQGRVYLAKGYVDTLRDGVVDDPYADWSRYYVATQPDGTVVGVCREILGTYGELPTLTRFPLDPEFHRWAEHLDPADVVEVSALAVDKTGVVSSREVSAGLYRAVWQYAVTTGHHRYWVANMSEHLLRTLNGAFGLGFEPIGPPAPYLGPPTLPCRLELATLPARVVRAHPAIAQWFCEGLPRPLVIDLTVPAQPAPSEPLDAQYRSLAVP